MLLKRDPAKLLDTIYESATDIRRWPQMIIDVADALGAHAATVTLEDRTARSADGLIARMDPESVPLYKSHFIGVIPYIQYPRRRSADLESAVNVDRQRLPKAELLKTEYYNDFLKPFGLHSQMSIGLGLEGTHEAVMSVFRPCGLPELDTPEIEIARSLQPHLCRAYKLARRIGAADPAAGDLAAILDHMPHAVFVLALGGRLLYVNRRAEVMLAARDGLSLSGQSLRAATSDLTRKPQSLIALAGSLDPERRQGGSMLLLRPSGRTALSAIVAPMRSANTFPLQPSASVIVSVTDPDCGIDLPAARLRQLFGLTQAEAAIALELVAGASPKEAAERRKLSYHTVRVHIARILAKTETNRQADLIRLLMRVAEL